MEENAKRSAEWRKKGTKEEQDAKKAAHAARVKEKRRAKKLAQNSQNQALPEFQRIQTVPKALQVSKSQSHKGRLPDGISSFGGTELIRKRKPIDFTMDDLETEKSDDNDEEFIADVEMPERRTMPKRNCNNFDECLDSSKEINSSLDDYIDDLVETTIDNLKAESQMVVKSVITSLITKVIGPRKIKRKVFVGQKSRRALKSSKYRKFHETDDQYQSRLKKSSALKQDNLKNEERSVRKRRLFKLQQTRYV